MIVLGGFYKLCVYLLIGAFCLIPLYLIIIPATIAKGVDIIKNGTVYDEENNTPDIITPEPVEKDIQWIVREETENERRK